MKSLVLKRSVVIAGRKTSVCVEEEFWKSVKEIAGERNMTVAELVGEIDANRQHANLSSALRLFVLGVYRDRTDLAKDRKAEPEVAAPLGQALPPARDSPNRAALRR